MSTGLSDAAQQLLATLRQDGQASNWGSLVSKLGLSEEEFTEGLRELVNAGLVTVDGKRVRRTTTKVSAAAGMLLAALPADGQPVGNLRLRSRLQFDDDTYAGAKKELLSAGLARAGVGKGGTLARVEPTDDSGSLESSRAAHPGLVRLERELYEPFAAWLKGSFAEDEGLFAHVKVTASDRRGRGKWSEPDATAVRVIRHEWLPGVTVEVLSYELKRAVDAVKIESVYEAAAHQRWAHWASLVIEQESPESEPADDVVSEVQRFGLGLYTMTRRRGAVFEIRQVVEPVRAAPPPENVNELLSHFFRRETAIRAQYRALIG